jgi:hypothetical protein
MAVLTGCAARSTIVDPSDPAVQARIAVMALSREDFDAARPRLLDLAAQCRSGQHGRRAVLLLAAAELDPANESGSPSAALHLARGYLLLPNAPRDEIVLARTLYRVAAELGGLDEGSAAAGSSPGVPVIAPRFDGCDGDAELAFRPLPSTSSETLADRVHGLEATIEAQSDSLTQLDATRARVTALEQELERITQLLTSGSERHGATQRP